MWIELKINKKNLRFIENSRKEYFGKSYYVLN